MPYNVRQFLECLKKLGIFLFTIVLDDPDLDKPNLYANLEANEDEGKLYEKSEGAEKERS